METRHSIERPFGSEFSAIYNHCGVVKSQDLEIFNNFWGKNDHLW